jgi:hypothetical protein
MPYSITLLKLTAIAWNASDHEACQLLNQPAMNCLGFTRPGDSQGGMWLAFDTGSLQG